jgi:putative redox protein
MDTINLATVAIAFIDRNLSFEHDPIFSSSSTNCSHNRRNLMTSVRVSSNASHLGQDIAIRQFHLLADEPLDLGGNDTAPTPFEFVVAGLGACKAITVKMYAARKGWTLTYVSVDCTLEKVENSQVIQANLQLMGTLTDEQRQRLLEIADRCPVHKLLMSEMQVHTVLLPEQ